MLLVLQALAREKYPSSEAYTRAVEVDENVEKLIAEQKRVARTILRASEHVKKRVRIYVQSEHFHQAAAASDSTGGGRKQEIGVPLAFHEA